MTVEGFDAVFDPIGGRSFKKSFNILKSNGILVAYGFYNALMGRVETFLLILCGLSYGISCPTDGLQSSVQSEL